MAESNDETIQAALADESTPKPLRDAYAALQTQLAEANKTIATKDREAAFTKAGLADLPHRSLFEKSYEGDLTPEAIREAATPYGLVTDAAATAATADREALDAIARGQRASSGTPAGGEDILARMDTMSPAEIQHLINTRGAEFGVSLPASVGGNRLI